MCAKAFVADAHVMPWMKVDEDITKPSYPGGNQKNHLQIPGEPRKNKTGNPYFPWKILAV